MPRMKGYGSMTGKHAGEGPSANAKFNSNPNLKMTGGVVPFQKQCGNGPHASGPTSGPAKSHSS